MKTKRSVIEEKYVGSKKRHISFIKMVEERAAKMQTWVPFLPDDLMFKIFLLLPVKSLLRFTCVCKTWYKLIKCAEFVEAYNTHAEITPIFLRSRRVNKQKLDTYHVETQLKQSEGFCLFPRSLGFKRNKFIHFLEIENEKCKLIDLNISLSGSVVAVCNGLILINSMNQVIGMHSTRSSLDQPLVDGRGNQGRLVVMNPMTRKSIGFPLGTLPNGNHKESYGLAFSQTNNVYKVVHLFKDNLNYIACEIFSLKTRSWKAVDGPPGVLFRNFGHTPISTVGALHWFPGMPGLDYVISMGVDDERFSVTDLPTTMGEYDRLIEMGGFLSFVNSLDEDIKEVWVLMELEGPEWVKQHTIRFTKAILGYVVDDYYPVPCFALNAKKMVFRRRERLYSYDFDLEEFTEIEMDHGIITASENIMPHFNNLATWEPLEPIS